MTWVLQIPIPLMQRLTNSTPLSSPSPSTSKNKKRGFQSWLLLNTRATWKENTIHFNVYFKQWNSLRSIFRQRLCKSKNEQCFSDVEWMCLAEWTLSDLYWMSIKTKTSYRSIQQLFHYSYHRALHTWATKKTIAPKEIHSMKYLEARIAVTEPGWKQQTFQLHFLTMPTSTQTGTGSSYVPRSVSNDSKYQSWWVSFLHRDSIRNRPWMLIWSQCQKCRATKLSRWEYM